MQSRKCNEAYMLELAHKLDAIEPAARVMLAALESAQEHVGVVRLSRNSYEKIEAIRADVAAAIAAAKAAGIKAGAC